MVLFCKFIGIWLSVFRKKANEGKLQEQGIMFLHLKKSINKLPSITNILLLNIFIVGLIVVVNLMFRFDTQFFSCSFWLLCSDDGTPSNRNNLFFQLFASILVLSALIFTILKSTKIASNNIEKKYLKLSLTLVMLLIFNSIWSIVSITLNSFIAILLSIVLLLWYLDRKYSISTQQKFPIISKSFILLMISSGLMMVFGILVSITESSRACLQFPVCLSNNGISFEMMLVNLHRFFTLTTALFIIRVFQTSWKSYRENKHLLVSVTIGFTIFLGQSLIGGIQVIRNLPLDLLFVHSISSVIFILSLVYAFSFVKISEQSIVQNRTTILNDSQRRKDFLILNKPIIVALLLVTTYAGMVVGGGRIPEFSLTLWTIVGGALAAGGASAINQYIDKEIDLSMQRTAKRPLPSGRLEPAEALAIGISEVILSFFIFVSFVNLNAALLAMAGMFYYVFIYSKWLKHITVQNIVIGGGAGAIPPLVGWAAVTGGLNVPSLFLFALVFLWTPPHFWALALVRKNDYARASIPMMPVIMGEKKTRLQILLYTIQLVILTLLMPLFGVGGSIYFILAIILGLWLLSIAWQVYKTEGNKIAFKMYRYSSMYLAFIFLALVIDVLI
jgi:protoheme IX farnesyltransferase